ncbi:carboxymuconolactone decarboxylase family protein [Cupriavidus sp. NPDC089707]|uniref:carboxymuconolactone decarboxylase family protein n=1 Tax=Cupriavidus sp. NPDC089707 TaxID=3363963 RepID=UPI00381837C4
MSMISTPAELKYPWYVRLVFWLQRRKYGAELEPARLWGRTPGVFLALTGLYRALDRASSPIEPALRSLITVRVSQINWCEFCVDLNSATALERSVDAAKLSELADFDCSPRYSAREKAALRYAEAVTITGRRVDAAQMNELKTHFSDDAIIELTALIAFQNLSSKFNAALQVPAQGFCRMPPGAPGDVAGQAPQKIAR